MYSVGLQVESVHWVRLQFGSLNYCILGGVKVMGGVHCVETVVQFYMFSMASRVMEGIHEFDN